MVSIPCARVAAAAELVASRVDFDGLLDLLALVLSVAMIAGYYYFLSRRVALNPTVTIHGVNRLARRLWILSVMRNPSKDVMAVQTLRNFIMGASLMASTATLLVIGTLTLSSQADSFSRTWHVLNVYGSHSQEIWVLKILLLLITFVVAFFAFAMCVRLTNHVLFMMNVPDHGAHEELSPENVANRFNRAGNLFSIGIRAFLMSIPLTFWLFGPMLLVLATIGLVISLSRLDRSRIGNTTYQITDSDA